MRLVGKLNAKAIFHAVLTLRHEGLGIKWDQTPQQSRQTTMSFSCVQNKRMSANAINTLPGDYGRKTKIQRNWRGLVTGGGALLFNATVHANLNQTLIEF